MRSTIQQTPAWRLDVKCTPTKVGHNLQFLGFVPTARRPHEQVRLQATLTDAELQQLKKFFASL